MRPLSYSFRSKTGCGCWVSIIPVRLAAFFNDSSVADSRICFEDLKERWVSVLDRVRARQTVPGNMTISFLPIG